MSRFLSLLSLLVLALAAGCSDSDSPASGTSTVDSAQPGNAPDSSRDATAVTESHDGAVEEDVDEYVYRCTTGEEFVIVFGDQTAELYVNDIYHQLRQQPSGSGARYTDETVELMVKDDQALVMVGDTTHDCLAIEVYEQKAPGSEVIPQPGILEAH